ncbi:MAG: hypothetical protein A2580_12525 [Hydrogenophilales bacterium RIFOXYD1_FULL_62_11]|nr:MAG: hypothetical protein A2580_12525 [Hydrogenophilales bacterium RIFOXYD1_FULL_62_11]
MMHQELVEKRRWISEQRYLHALNYCMLLPGPKATQLAIYINWLIHGVKGGVIAGVLFFLPSFLLPLLVCLYLAYGDLPWVQGIFYGIKPAVGAIVLFAAWRIGSQVWRCSLPDTPSGRKVWQWPRFLVASTDVPSSSPSPRLSRCGNTRPTS